PFLSPPGDRGWYSGVPAVADRRILVAGWGPRCTHTGGTSSGRLGCCCWRWARSPPTWQHTWTAATGGTAAHRTMAATSAATAGIVPSAPSSTHPLLRPRPERRRERVELLAERRPVDLRRWLAAPLGPRRYVVDELGEHAAHYSEVRRGQGAPPGTH